jgi:hypothetical protein
MVADHGYIGDHHTSSHAYAMGGCLFDLALTFFRVS